MKKILHLFILFISASPSGLNAQYILNGSATQNNCNCYTLTPEVNTQSGSVWNSNKINLSQPFDFWFNINLGCKDTLGADGIVFILQPISTSIGTTGEGMGFEGILPSVGISLDTWQNTNRNDPVYDHINIQVNGVVTHGTDLSGPVHVSANSENIEDCQWHVLRIAWSPASRWLRSWFDDSLRVEAQVDLIGTVFHNNPNVYWGFSAATGGANNLQRFCTALNPGFLTNLPNNITCNNQPVIFQNTSQSFGPIQSYYWDFGDGTTSNQQTPPPKLYAVPGVYEVKMAVTGLDGCISDTLKKVIVIGTKPIPGFQIFDTCSLKAPRLINQSTNSVGNITNWIWMINGAVVSSSQQPQLTGLAPGNHEIKLAAQSIYGCISDTVSHFVNMNPLPQITANFPDGCLKTPIQFSAIQTDNSTVLSQWRWTFGDGAVSALQNPQHNFSIQGSYPVNVYALDMNGCSSDTINKSIHVVFAQANAGNDTIIIKDIPFQLQGSGGVSYSWSPSTGLNNPAISNPIAILQDDFFYLLTVTTAEGCIAADGIQISVFKGSAIYVPTGFTPNNDGLNDVLQPKYVGIKKLSYFIIYNRWGQKVFETKDLSKSWNGSINGVEQQTGTFIWVLKAEDYVGKLYNLKGAATIIR